jgi:hypothetical protein
MKSDFFLYNIFEVNMIKFLNIFLLHSLIFLLIILFCDAQPKIDAKFNAFLDTYIVTDNDKLPDGNPERTYSFLNHYKDQFGLNLATLGTNISYGDLVRSTISFQLGDLQKATLPKGVISPYIQQANVGFQLFSHVWLDGGYFLTHVGNETLMPKDNWLTSYNLVTYFEPIYQAGMKLSYESDAFTACFHVLNGNGILADNNVNKTFGFSLLVPLSKDVSVSYAGVYGNEEDDNPAYAKFHHLHNINLNAQVEKVGFKLQFDYAGKEKVKNDNKDPGVFWGAAFTTRYSINNQYSSTARFSYVNNADEVEGYPVKGLDFTLGGEFKPMDNAYIRLEGRYIMLDGDLYKYFHENNGNPKNSRMEINFNMGVWIN